MSRRSFYKQLTREFNSFNKWNNNLLNKHQFSVYPVDQDADEVAFGLVLPSMLKTPRHAIEPAVGIGSMGGFDDEDDFTEEELDIDADADAYERRLQAVGDLHQCLLEYLDDSMIITSNFEQGGYDVPDDGKKLTIENLFYIFQWYANIREDLMGTELYELPMELDDRCSDMSIDALREVMGKGVLDKDLGEELIKKGKFLTTFFGNVFPLVAPDESTNFNAIVKACLNSNFKKPVTEYKKNGFSKVEFNGEPNAE